MSRLHEHSILFLLRRLQFVVMESRTVSHYLFVVDCWSIMVFGGAIVHVYPGRARHWLVVVLLNVLVSIQE